jgi:hypothetical protein
MSCDLKRVAFTRMIRGAQIEGDRIVWVSDRYLQDISQIPE